MSKDKYYEDQKQNTKILGCPYIKPKIQDKDYVMLIDSGAEVSAISTQLETQLIKNHGAIPTFLLSGLQVHNSIGGKSIKVSRQVLVPTIIGVTTIQIAFIVVPQLNEIRIIGNNFLENNKCILDYDKQEIRVKITENIEKASFNKKKNGLPANLKTIQIYYNKEPMKIKLVKQPLSNEQKHIDEIIEQFSDDFKKELGKIKGYECKIRLYNDTPIRVKPYQIPLAKQTVVENEVKRMLNMGIIERSNSPYSISKVPVFKKNGEVWLCLDARKLNAQIIPDCERPNTLESILVKFESIKCISTLDLKSGYWQVPLAKESQPPCSY